MCGAVVGFPLLSFLGAFLGGLFMIHFIGEFAFWPIAVGGILPPLALALWLRQERREDEQDMKFVVAQRERDREAARKVAIAKARASGAFDRFGK